MTDYLTRREWEVLRLVARGHSDKTIARLLLISPLTVRKHLEHIYTKLGVHSRTEAVAWAAQTSNQGNLFAWLAIQTL